MTGVGSNAEERDDWPSPLYAWYVVCVITLLVITSWIDRQIISLLVEPIREDLQISDTEISLLHGVTFGIFFGLMGLPLGIAADRYNRRNIIVVGAAVWTAMTAACGLAQSYWQLFVARIGVGVGEASLGPSAGSMIADYFPPEKLGQAMSVYMSGILMGIGFAYIVGGAVIEVLTAIGPLALPLIGELKVWQATFVVVGLSGLPLAALMLSVREPSRRGLLLVGGNDENAKTAQPHSIGKTWKFLTNRRDFYISHFLGFGILGCVGVGIHAWAPTFFIRTYGWTAADAGMVYGVLVVICATAGVLFGGVASRYLMARGHREAYWTVSYLPALLSAPLAVVTFLAPTAVVSLIFMGALQFFLSVPAGMSPAAYQLVTPNQFRGQVSAVLGVGTTIFTMAIGPTVVALLTDFAFGDDNAIRYSLVLMSATLLPLYAAVFWFTMPIFRKTLGATALWRAESIGASVGRPAMAAQGMGGEIRLTKPSKTHLNQTGEAR